MKAIVLSFFDKYLHDTDLDDLINSLELFEIRFKTDDELNLWFRFGSDDTLVTTISDIRADLSLPTKHLNHVFMVEKMGMVCDANSGMELEIHV